MRRLTVFRVSVGVAAIVAAIRLVAPTSLELLDLKALDTRFLVRGAVAPQGEIVIVGIDERSLAELGRWPWPRRHLAGLVERLSSAGAAAIGLDIVLDQPDKSVELATLQAAIAAAPELRAGDLLATLESNYVADAQLATAFRRAGRVVLGHFFELGGRASAVEDAALARLPELSVRARGGATPESIPALAAATAFHVSVPALAAAAASEGHLNVLPDADGINRSVPLVIRLGNRLVPALSVELLRQYLGAGAATVLLAPGEVVGIRVGDRQLHVNTGGYLRVNYLGPQGTFRHLPAADVLAKRVAGSEIAGKIALVGFTASGFDEIATPFDPVVPGVELQATALDNLLRGASLRRPPWLIPVEAAVVLLLGLAIGLVLQRAPGVGGWLAALGMAGLYTMATQWAFESRALVLSAIYPVGAIVSCTLGAAIFQAIVEEREKRKIRHAFRHYLNPEVTDLVARDPTQLRLGGERREITVFFSDIRGFTGIAEQMEPEELGKLLNEYLGAMTDIIFRHEGLLDKYIGDAIMAFWGAPMGMPDHAQRCCRAALDMQSALAVLHANWDTAGMPRIEMRIGIDSGEAVVGNFGSTQRFSYTAIGDHVNLASRLEGLNKEYGTCILISEATRQAIGGEFVCRAVDRVQVKGRTQPVTVYELVGRNTNAHRN